MRKRYLALALRLHPDKVAHAGTQEAFAAMEAAYIVAYESSVLADEAA